MTCSLFSAGELKWKENLVEKAQSAFLQRQRETPNLRMLVYGKGQLALTGLTLEFKFAGKGLKFEFIHRHRQCKY